MCARSCYSWLCMALSYDFVMCAIMLLLTVHGVVSGLRDVCFYVTLDCAWRCLMTSWCALSCYSWQYMALSYDYVIRAVMLLLTVHGMVLWPRDMYFHATLDSAWRCLMTSWYVLLCYSWLCMALSNDSVMCAFMLLLTGHGVVSGLRDVCAFMSLLTVHGVV